MSEFTEYNRIGKVQIRPYIPGEIMSNISVSEADKGCTEGYIARDNDNPEDKWFISADFFAKNYAAAVMGKTLHNSRASGARVNVKDIKFWGNGDMWKLMSKASSKAEGWMKSTKCLMVQHGCLIQVTTQQGDHIAEAVTFVPGVRLVADTDETGEIVGRHIETA